MSVINKDYNGFELQNPYRNAENEVSMIYTPHGIV
jgi:hypothetical protein